jgi:hypothetical protein
MFNFVMMRNLRYLLLLCSICTLSGRAQDAGLGGYEGGTNLNVLYRNDVSGKVYAHTRGFGALFRQGRHVTSKTRSFYEIDLQTLRHPKEVKLAGDADRRKRFVYGKVNSVMLLRGSFGMQNILFHKGDHKAVEVRYSYSAGPVLGFVKPYYYQVYRNSLYYNRGKSDLVKFDTESFSQDSGRIVGRGSLLDGLAETRIYPGVNGKFNLSFEYAPYTNLIRAIETGVSVDYFPKAIPMMARNRAENFMITLHVGLVFGRKWF